MFSEDDVKEMPPSLSYTRTKDGKRVYSKNAVNHKKAFKEGRVATYMKQHNGSCRKGFAAKTKGSKNCMLGHTTPKVKKAGYKAASGTKLDGSPDRRFKINKAPKAKVKGTHTRFE